MKGYVTRKNSNKKYYPVIYLGQDEITKKKNYKWGTGYDKKRDAEKELSIMLYKYSSGEMVTKPSETFRYVYEQWVELIVPELYKSEQSVATSKGYANKHMLPYFGATKITTITTQHIQKFFFQLRVEKYEKIKGKTVKQKVVPAAATNRKIFSVLNSIFSNAKNWGLVEKIHAKESN